MEKEGGAPSYWLTRFVILRLLGAVYFFAFLSLLQQVLPLLGENGLLPAASYLREVGGRTGSPLSDFLRLPGIFWLDVSDGFLVSMAWLGVVLSLVVALGFASGLLLVSFQGILILSGNLSFLNWLTIVPMLACFDDSFMGRILPRRVVERARRAAAETRPARGQRWVMGGLVVLVAALSIAPVANLLSDRQVMNTSFDRLHLVNTYGAFGSVGRERHEIIFQGTADSTPGETSVWKEYEFKAKPGDPGRRPPLVSPYHYRLDWQIWFAAMSTPDRCPWTVHFVWKLLHGDPGTLSLLAGNPFPDSPPRAIRAELYTYRFAPPGEPGGAWWKRTRIGAWMRPLTVDDPGLRRFLAAYGWLPQVE